MSVALQRRANSVKWRTVRLGDVLTLINGRAYKKDEERDSGTPVLRIQNLNGGDRWFYSDLTLPDNKYCEKGDLLFAWSATFGPYIWWGKKVIYHYHIWKIECGPELDKGFAYYLLQHITEKVKAAGRGISMIHMTKGGMEEWEVSIPPLVEQKRIAAILDQAEELRRKRQRALDRLSQLGQAIFHEMFGDPSVNPRDLPIIALGDLATRITDGEHQTPRRSDKGYKLLSARNVRDGYIDFENVDYVDEEEYQRISKRCAPKMGDVLISCSGTIGRVSVVNTREPFVLVRSAALVVLDEGRILPEYLAEYLRTSYMFKLMNQSANSSGQPNLFQNQIKRLPIIVPPLKEQKACARTIAAIRQAPLADQQASMLAIGRLFASIQHRAFQEEL